MSEKQNTPPAPPSATRPRSFACWAEQTTDVAVIDAPSHHVAAIRYMHQVCAVVGDESNPPSADRVGVVDLEYGETWFVMVKFMTAVSSYQTSGAGS